MTAAQALGWFILSIVFIWLFWFTCEPYGWRESAKDFLKAIALTAVIAVGAYLAKGA